MKKTRSQRYFEYLAIKYYNLLLKEFNYITNDSFLKIREETFDKFS